MTTTFTWPAGAGSIELHKAYLPAGSSAALRWAFLRTQRRMFNLPQFASVQIQPKVDSEFGEVAQEIERQDLVTVRVRENADKALDRPTLVNYPPQEVPVRSECLHHAFQKWGQFSVLGDLKPVKPMAELPIPFKRRAFGRRLGFALPRRSVSRLQGQRSGYQFRSDIRMADVKRHAVVEVLQSGTACMDAEH